MSYSQFGYTYPASSQLVVGQSSGGGSGGEGYDARVLSFPFGLYAPSSYPHEAHFYTALPSPFDLKESRGSWSTLQQSTAACYPYDPNGLASYPDRYGGMDSVARRKNATRETTNTLKAWLYEHRKNPYPTKGEKIMLAIITKMTLTQVSTWFANARRRLKKENKMTWEPRNKTSEGDDRDSSSPLAKSDDSNLPDYMKPEPSPTDRKPDPGFSIDDCYRVRTTPDDSGSASPGYKDRPKIWSLARTATSDSPPANRRPPPVPDYPAKNNTNCPNEDMKMPPGCYGSYPDRKSNCRASPLSGYKEGPGSGDMKSYRDFSLPDRTGLKDCLPSCYGGDFPKDDKMGSCYRGFPDRKSCPESPFTSERTAGLSSCYRQFPSTDDKVSSVGESAAKSTLCFREYDRPGDAGLCYRDSGSALKDCPDMKVYGSRDYAASSDRAKDCPSMKLPDAFRDYSAGLAKSESDECLESSGSSSCMLDVRPPYIADFPPIVDSVPPEQQYFPSPLKDVAPTAFKCHLEMTSQGEWSNQEGERQNER